MFIQQIYEALQNRRNVVLVGPIGCGKSTVLAGVLSKMQCDILSRHMSDVGRINNNTGGFEGKIFLIEGIPSPEVCGIVKTLSSGENGPRFVFMTSDASIPSHLYDARRVDVIGWPESECPP